jgi:acyl-coenzyme A synthetase/AMP-(fatty) acid ligase
MSNGHRGADESPHLFFAGSLGTVVARRNGRPVSQAAFLHDVEQVAQRLPDRPYVINCCNDRYVFLTSFVAAILRRQITLLSGVESDVVRRELSAQYPGLYRVTDAPVRAGDIESHQINLGDRTPTGSIPVPTMDLDQIVALVFTSGSTGRPTPHAKSLRALTTGATTIAGDFGIGHRPPATILATVPSQHMYGLEFTIMQSLCGIASVAANRPFYPWDIADALSELPNPRLLVTTPVHLRTLLESIDRLPEIAKIYSAGSPLAKHVAERAERQYGTIVIECYGCTEAGSIAVRQPVRDDRWRPLQGYTIVPWDQGHAVRLPFLADPVVLPDTIELSSDGSFILTGRVADVINIAGKRASLSGLNAILTSIDGIHDGAFYVPSESPSDHVTRLKAFVVAPDLSADDIRRQLRDRIDSSFLPRQIIHLSSLPRRDNGKLAYESLVDLARTNGDEGNPDA